MLRRMRSVIAKRQAESKEENGESKHRTPNTEGRTPNDRGTGTRPIRPPLQPAVAGSLPATPITEEAIVLFPNSLGKLPRVRAGQA